MNGRHGPRALLWLCAASLAAPLAEAEGRGSYRLRVIQDLDHSEAPLLEQRLDYQHTQYLGESARLFFHGRLRNEDRDRLEPDTPEERQYRSALSRRYFMGTRSEAEVYELYVDGYLGDTFYRLGKQSIVWGTAFGLTVLDLVNPSTWREFILPDQDERRIPLWSVNVERTLGDWAAQLIWVPDPTYRQLPEENALFALRGYSDALLRQSDKPDDPIRDADSGLRLTTFAGGWDITLNYLYHYDDMPVVESHVVDGRLSLQPRYYRVETFGSALSNAFGAFTLRAELGLHRDRRFTPQLSGSATVAPKSDEVSAVLGVDYSGIRDLLISAQLFHSQIMDDPPDIARARQQQRATLQLRRDYLNDTLHSELQWIHDLDRHDGLAKLFLDYQFSARTTVKLGVDVLYGQGDGDFGQFADRDRAYVDIEYQF